MICPNLTDLSRVEIWYNNRNVSPLYYANSEGHKTVCKGDYLMSDHTPDSSDWLVVKIPLTQGQETIIDIENADLAELKWTVAKKRSGYYAYRSGNYYGDKPKRKHSYLARIILERKIGRPLEKHERADHINGDTLDNREQNLRVATNTQNCQNSKRPQNNTSGYKGVSSHSSSKKWRARIKVDNKQLNLGYFDTREEAHEAYKKAALEYHGEFARWE